MSAYRTLSSADLESVRRYTGAESLADCRPISAGIENSNWFITLTHRGHPRDYVLTLVEAVPADELPFFIALTDALAEADLPVPMALRLADGRRQFTLQDKPALLMPRLPGAHVLVPTTAHCRALGTTLAQLHAGATHCALPRERPDHRWWPVAFAYIAPLLTAEVHTELATALLDATRTFAQTHALPHGIIHGDLFRDNVLLTGDEVTGVLDFFHATHDLLAWDVAIALNDWAVVDGVPDAAREAALLAGYAQSRPLTPPERALLPALRRAAAARFWLSRLVAAEKPAGKADAAVLRKSPSDMRNLLRALSAPL